MGRKKVLILACLLMGPASVSAGDFGSSCADEWPRDYRMQEYCIERQEEAFAQFLSWGRHYKVIRPGAKEWRPRMNSSNPYQEIFYDCMSQWEKPKYSTYDYRMVIHCIDKQIGAYERLKGRR